MGYTASLIIVPLRGSIHRYTLICESSFTTQASISQAAFDSDSTRRQVVWTRTQQSLCCRHARSTQSNPSQSPGNRPCDWQRIKRTSPLTNNATPKEGAPISISDSQQKQLIFMPRYACQGIDGRSATEIIMISAFGVDSSKCRSACQT
jgi:hypothetical protein